MCVERRRLETEKLQIERKQQKLLEAHYNDAIPVDLLRTEQKRLESELASALRSLEALIEDLNELDQLITQVLDISENLGRSYGVLQINPSGVSPVGLNPIGD